MPKKLISDQASTFRSRKLRSFLRRAGVEHHFSSPYHPQANGLTERTNQTIQARLAPYVVTNKDGEADWDKHLQSAAYSINSCVQSSTGTTPYEVVYWQLPRLNVAARVDTPVKVGQAVARQVACKNIRRGVQNNIRAAQKMQKTYYDHRHRRAPQYAVGDEVWVQRGMHVAGRKLLPKFEGPFLITKRLGENTWRVATLPNDSGVDRRKKDTFAVHVSRMKERVCRTD